MVNIAIYAHLLQMEWKSSQEHSMTIDNMQIEELNKQLLLKWA